MEIMERKVFFVWTMDKEKAYLEKMGRKGYSLTNVKLFKYYFEKVDPIDYVYEFDFQYLLSMSEEEYLSFFEDWELVKRFGLWYYFRKVRSNDAYDEIYNDNESKSKMYKTILIFLVFTGFPLYINIILLYPLLGTSNLTLFNFYRIFKYILFILTPIHFLVSASMLSIYLGYKKRIKE